jgi:hypothetical protein
MEDSVKVILNKQVNVGKDRAKLLRVSGTQNTYQSNSVNGVANGGSILFSNIALPSLSNSVISRNMRIRYKLTVQATNPNATGLTNPIVALGANGATAALRQFPLSTCTDTITCTINNVPTSLNLRQVLPAITKTIPLSYFQKEASECPAMPDNAPVLMTDKLATALTSAQPLSSYWNSQGYSRASFQPIAYAAGAGGSNNIVTYEITEPVFCQPLCLDSDSEFLANVNTLSVQYNYSNLQDAVVYGMAAAYPAGYTVSIDSTSVFLELTVISLDNRLVAVPSVVSYPYEQPQYYNTPFTFNITGGGACSNTQTSYTAQSQSLRLSYMPSLIYLYGQVSPTTRAAGSIAGAASFADFNLSFGTTSASGLNANQIGAISITLNNRQGLLQGASLQDLYRLAVSHGYGFSFSQWLLSPVVIVSPSKDLGLDMSASSDIYPLMTGNVVLQVQAIFNTSNIVAATVQTSVVNQAWLPAATQFQFQIVCLQSGIAEISPDTMILQAGPLSSAEVNSSLKTAPGGEYIPSDMVDDKAPSGLGGALHGAHGHGRSVVSSTARGMHAGVLTGGVFTGGSVHRRK